jgi:hypothetical protein
LLSERDKWSNEFLGFLIPNPMDENLKGIYAVNSTAIRLVLFYGDFRGVLLFLRLILLGWGQALKPVWMDLVADLGVNQYLIRGGVGRRRANRRGSGSRGKANRPNGWKEKFMGYIRLSGGT